MINPFYFVGQQGFRKNVTAEMHRNRKNRITAEAEFLLLLEGIVATALQAAHLEHYMV